MDAGGQAQTFLTGLFGTKNDDDHILIWTKDKTGPGKRSHWFTDVTAAAAIVSTPAAAGRNVYVGAGLADTSYGPTKRAVETNIVALPALWIDIDIADPERHKKANLPPTMDTALDLLAECDLAPTFVVASGGGVQAWWAFPSLWRAPDDNIGSEALWQGNAKALTTAWGGYWKRRAALHGWDVDSTHDLARVMRLPGTMNVKADPVPVALIVADGPRHDLSTIRQHVKTTAIGELPLDAPDGRETRPDDGSGVGDHDGGERRALPPRNAQGDGSRLDAASQQASTFVLDAGARVDMEKFEALAETDARFRKSWERKRSTRDMQDQSASSYDMSLATFAASADWTDQEIVDLLIAARRKHGDDLKLRDDYYARTIRRARRPINEARAQAQLEDDIERIQNATGDDDAQPDAGGDDGDLLDTIRRTMNVPITRIEKHLTTPPTYWLHTDSGSVELGGVAGLTDQGRLRNHIADATGAWMRKFKSQQWDSIVQLLLRLAVPVDVGDEGTKSGALNTWVEQYVADKRPHLSTRDSTIISRDPFIEEGWLYVYLQQFRQWVFTTYGERMGGGAFASLLKTCGFDPHHIAVMVDGKPTTRSVYRREF